MEHARIGVQPVMMSTAASNLVIAGIQNLDAMHVVARYRLAQRFLTACAHLTAPQEATMTAV